MGRLRMRMRMRTLAGAGVLGLVAMSTTLVAAEPWIEIKTAHFTIVSNSGQGAARNLAWQMEQIRSALAARGASGDFQMTGEWNDRQMGRSRVAPGTA